MNKTTLVSSTFENPSTRLCFFLLFLAQTTVLSRQKPFRWLNTRSDQRSYIYFVMVGGEKQSLSPKEIIHHKFGVKASYRIEQVHVSSQSTCLYRCHLQLPDFSVVSNVFKRKKDAELSAAELALEKLGIHPQGDDDDDDDITVEQAWDDIVERIKYIFSDEFLSSDHHPLGSHLRGTLLRDGERRGSLPLSVIAAFDAKINSRCKVINPSVDKDPILAMSYVLKAAAKLSDYIVASPHVAALRRKNPYPPAVVEALATHGESIKVEAVYIQCATSGEEVVDPITLDISSGRYYLDIIAEKLGLKDSSQLIISRTFGKTPSGYECRVYSAIPKLNPSDKSSKAYGKRPVDDEEDQSSRFKNPWNAKASSACGQDIHGDAIVAALGYSWRSNDLEHDDVTLKSFYRICCGMSPNGIYKFSRQALIAATLPFSFTTKSSWRGPLPKEMLSIFCRQQQLAEPVFTISTSPVKPLSETLRSLKKLKDSESNDSNNQCVNEYAGSDDSFNHYNSKDEEELPVLESGYKCGVKILSKSLQDLVLDCSPRNFYEKESYAIQNAALKALTWFGSLFDDLDADPEQPRCYTKGHMNWMFTRNIMIKGKFPSSKRYEEAAYDESKTMDMDRKPKRVQTIPNGSLVSISYSVCVEVEADFWGRSGKCLRELIESNEEIEFEVGVGSMNPHLESVVTQMSVGQYACFVTNMPAEGLVLADANDTARTRSLLSKLAAGLEYSVHLLGVKGPTEKRVESVFFKPPLWKQRVGYAVKLIKESSASTLVEFGCGSGSLLESLLEVPTSLQTIVGVDISQKALDRAAKMLDSKLNKGACNLKTIRLYDGSILEFDSRLHGIDIATCLEVIEHMEEDEAFQFGKTVLTLFRPKLLIVSTPNYEYNKILHKSSLYHSKDRSMSQRSKFRSHDHKFEWTRAQFSHWASKLAKSHNYSVEFSGVGGSGDVDPGFASQIAVFKQKSFTEVKKVSMQPYKLIWEWTRAEGDNKN
ncbi:small RNA 2'-O-methyltransferase [Brassica rapa]|uniref:small RNA 2'-O-methyltransferase n=1 Tax=Brassica campestris TaxID=3711 RepID=UPI00142E1686|nr:small RNA 2'-O-methyltransferase [Brassica rapa]